MFSDKKKFLDLSSLDFQCMQFALLYYETEV